MHAIVLIVCKTSGKGTVIQIIAQYFTILEKINKYFTVGLCLKPHLFSL
jgi:hypothetical protein